MLRRRRRNPAPAGYNRGWYQKGFRAGLRGDGDDMYGAWRAQHGKPSRDRLGAFVTAQESFYKGFVDGVMRKPKSNPSLIPSGRWIRAQVRKIGKNLHINIIKPRRRRR